MKFQIGCDPEVFVGDGTGVKSIIGTVGGTKANPKPLLKLGPGFAVQEDNVALEFNVPPASMKGEFVRNVMSSMSFLGDMLSTEHGLQFVKDSAISFPDAELQHPAAKQFGCDPDFNVWSGKRNPRPASHDPNLRSVGGHIHIGLDESFDDNDKPDLIKAMDLFISVPAVFMDTGLRRKELYGKAGAWRNKPYGVEYRTPSNFWIWDPDTIAWVYDNTSRAIEFAMHETVPDEDGDLIQYAINRNDPTVAKMLVNRYHLDVRHA